MMLSWWVLPTTVLLLLAWLLLRLRRRWPAPVWELASRAAGLEAYLASLGERCRQRAQEGLQRYLAFRANRKLYYKLSDYEQELEAYHHEVGGLCSDIRDTLMDLRRELRYSGSGFPDAPDWSADIESAVAELAVAGDDGRVAKSLKRLQQTAQRQYGEAMREYRWAAAVRQRILARSGPHWKRMRRSIQDIQRLLKHLSRRREDLTDVSARYAGLQAAAAASVSGTRFIVTSLGWLLLLALAAVATVLNAGLMYEVLGQVLPDAGSIVPALIVAHTGGLLLFGALLACAMRWSLLLPTVSAMPWEQRRRLVLGCVVMLVLLGLIGLSALVDQLTTELVVAGASAALPALIYSATLYMLPLLSAFLVPLAARVATLAPPALQLLVSYPISLLAATCGLLRQQLENRWPQSASENPRADGSEGPAA